MYTSGENIVVIISSRNARIWDNIKPKNLRQYQAQASETISNPSIWDNIKPKYLRQYQAQVPETISNPSIWDNIKPKYLRQYQTQVSETISNPSIWDNIKPKYLRHQTQVSETISPHNICVTSESTTFNDNKSFGKAMSDIKWKSLIKPPWQ